MVSRSEIIQNAQVKEPWIDLEGSPYGDRPILLESFGMVDRSDVLVPVEQSDPEGMMLALTREQGVQALVNLARQLGFEEAIEAIRDGQK